MANEILVPKKAEKLITFKAKYPFLFDATTGEQYSEADLEQHEIDILVKDGVMQVEKIETPIPAVETKAPETTANKAIQKLGAFTFVKMANTKQAIERITNVFNTEETVKRNLENDIEDAKESPSILLNFVSEGLYGSANIAFQGLNVNSAKGTKSVCVISQPITESQFEELKTMIQTKVSFVCEEFRIKRENEELKELNFQTDLQGGFESKEYRCFGIINNQNPQTLYMVVPYDAKKNRWSVGGKFFNNVAEYNLS